MKSLMLFISLFITANSFAAESKTPRKPANNSGDVTAPITEKKIVISNKYCTAEITGTGDNYGVVVHILDPRNGKEINKEYVMNPVSKEQALKLLDSASCG